MNRALAFVITLALASFAFAEDAAKAEPKKPPPLNLRLDEGSSAAPRINFAPPVSAQSKEEREKSLPEMGGRPNQAFNRPVSPDGVNSSSPNNSVIPSAMDPAINRQ